jgi:hypothetical protein
MQIFDEITSHVGDLDETGKIRKVVNDADNSAPIDERCNSAR